MSSFSGDEERGGVETNRLLRGCGTADEGESRIARFPLARCSSNGGFWGRGGALVIVVRAGGALTRHV